ncbi:ATP/GTP-binding protein [Streptomyces sp. NPDC048717]|uniref:GTP-binding protein n=1 Tax=Streptomyces sp. NPDC048717 TaxID=3154928 RepID=UPI0034339F88
MSGCERTVKILVAGPFAVGKTTLVHGLSQIAPVSTEAEMTSAGSGIDHTDLPAKKSTTVAMDFGRLHLADDLVLYLFGAPGQSRFFPVLTDLARGALGALVLADTRRLEETYPVLEHIELLGLPYVMAVNLFDGAPRYPLERLREAMDLAPRAPLVSFDARDAASSRQALIALVRHLLMPESSR